MDRGALQQANLAIGGNSQGVVASDSEDSQLMTSEHHEDSLPGFTAPSKRSQQVPLCSISRLHITFRDWEGESGEVDTSSQHEDVQVTV